MAYSKNSYVRNDIRHPFLGKFLVISYLAVPTVMGFVLANLLVKSTIFLTALGLFLGGFAFYIRLLREHTASFKQAERDFSLRGFTADYALPSCLLIDSRKRKIAFVSTSSNTYETYDFSDIVSWEHSWEDHTKSDQNLFDGRAVNLKVASVKNALIFKTNNPMHPFHRLEIPRHGEATIWMAKISALLKKSV